MTKEILTHPHPVLAKPAETIETITPEIKQLADEMVDIMYANNGIGLAAPQIGHSYRLITVDISGPEERSDLRVLVNPEIVKKEGEVQSDEGCLSVMGLRATAPRYEKVTVKAKDLEGNDVTIEADGMLAICLQHEIDHINGTLFIDRISRLKRSLYEKKLKKWLRKQEKDSDSPS